MISNRDVSSLKTLDLWLEYIETDQRIPLFDPSPQEYVIPRLEDVDWENEIEYEE